MSQPIDRPLGSLYSHPPGHIADMCARVIMGYASPRAVSIDPEGRVWIERPCDAAESDMIGVYTRSLGLRGLEQMLRDDLMHEWGQRRGWSAKRNCTPRARHAAAAFDRARKGEA